MSNTVSPLTPTQIELLNWVRNGCPDGVYEGTAHRTSARALAAKGLLKVRGHGPDWKVTITDAGREWKPTELGLRLPKKRSARASTPPVVVRRTVPAPLGAREQAIELMDKVIAADGHFPLPEGPGMHELHERLVRLSLSAPNRPRGKKLEIVRVGGGWYGPREIVFTDHFDDLVEQRPVPVLDHVGKYSPVVRTYLDQKDWHYVSRDQVQRAARVLEAIVREAPNRGVKISAQGGVKCHVAFGVEGSTYEVQIREISAPGGPELPYDLRRRGPKWTHDRLRVFVSTGQLELIVRGRYANYDGDRFRDTKLATVEEKLPRLFQKLEIYRLQAAAAVEQERLRKEDRRRRWEAAMAEAKAQYDHHARWSHFKQTSLEWRKVGQHRDFLVAARAAAATYEGEDGPALLAQLDMAERTLDELDPVRHPELLVPVVKAPKDDDLKPFLGGWSPNGPDGY